MMRCKVLAGAATVVAFVGLTVLAAAAQTFPERTVRIIVPTSPGGSIDATARTIAAKLSAKWGTPVIVENRAGAAMRLGTDAVAKAAPDGYTLLVAHDGAMATNPVLFSDLPYHPQKDFAPVAMMVSIPEVIMASAAIPATSLAEMLALARKNPGKLEPCDRRAGLAAGARAVQDHGGGRHRQRAIPRRGSVGGGGDRRRGRSASPTSRAEAPACSRTACGRWR